MELKKQHRGGMANFKGNAYEHFFAVWRTALALGALSRGEPSRLALQLEDCHVDDWVEDEPNERRHFQLKNKKKLAWRDVADQFARQLAEPGGRRRRQHQRVTLVVSRKNQMRALRKSSRAPEGSLVEHFPGFVRPQRYWKTAPVKETLRKVCLGNTQSDFETVWFAIDAAWQQACKPGKFVEVSRVLERLSDQDIPLRVPWRAPRGWTKCKKLLSAVNGLRWTIDGGHFCYDDGAGIRGRFSCRTPALRDFVRRVLQSPPSTIGNFRELL